MTASAPFLLVLVADSFQGLRAREERMSHQPSSVGWRRAQFDSAFRVNSAIFSPSRGTRRVGRFACAPSGCDSHSSSAESNRRWPYARSADQL
jgi:hypothetical protein